MTKKRLGHKSEANLVEQLSKLNLERLFLKKADKTILICSELKLLRLSGEAKKKGYGE